MDIEFHLDLLCHFAVVGRAVTYALGLALLAYPQKKKFPLRWMRKKELQFFYFVLLLPGNYWTKGSIDLDMLANTSKLPNGSPVTVVPFGD